MLTEVGALVGVVKGLFDLTKTGVDLFGKRAEAAKLPIAKLQQRMAGLAEQFERSAMLSKLLPVWLKEHSRFDLYEDTLSDDDVRSLDDRLRYFVRQSNHDYFSGVFFRTSFGTLPGVETAMAVFQQRLTALEQNIDNIPPGNAQAWRAHWPVLKIRLHDLRVEAVKIDNLADHVQAQLIREMREAAEATA